MAVPNFPSAPTLGQEYSAPNGVPYVWDGTVWVAHFSPQHVAYRHVQTTAATSWAITHDLTFKPNVAVVDSTGREIVPGAVDYPSTTTVTLTFSAAVGGEAYLS